MSQAHGDWGNFFLAAAGAAAALTGLLFVAVSLRPSQIRESPFMAGRARAAFYALVTVLLVGLLALAGQHPSLVGAAEFGVAVAMESLSVPFSLAAMQDGRLNYARAAVYHAGVVIVAVAGFLQAAAVSWSDTTTLLACGLLMLLGIGVSNAWQLVLSHDPDQSG
ncbi:MAG: hypothetical protein JOZ68_02260 [Acidimicrobiia bacterium]|nr:hypothetical protein [Acidimicrobiia bacterium]